MHYGSMSSPTVKPSRPHLRAFLLAMTVLLLLLPLVSLGFQRMSDAHMRELIVMPIKAKDQGERIQHEAFLRDDVLPVIGSSELTLDVENRASDVFLHKPTGFQVCPIGRAGNSCLLMAEKVAALGERMRGKKMALIFSSSWFYRATVPADSYAGNFSPLQVMRLLQNGGIDAGLRKRFLARMLEFPDTFDSRPLLGAYIRNTANNGIWPALKCAAMRPLLEIQKTKLTWEDLFATSSVEITLRLPECVEKPVGSQAMEWDRKIAELEAKDAAVAAADPEQSVLRRVIDHGENDNDFLAELHASKEWDDFQLVLDTLKLFGAKACFISVPLSGTGFDRKGVSRAARDVFYRRFESVCADHGYQAQTFSDHDLDDGFTIPRSSHFTPKGWLYVDRVLDDFYHDRPIGKERK